MKKTKIICTRDFSEKFKEYWNFNFQSHMKKGWETWIDETRKHELSEENKDFKSADGHDEPRLHPEENKHHVNFPKSHFKVIEG